MDPYVPYRILVPSKYNRSFFQVFISQLATALCRFLALRVLQNYTAFSLIVRVPILQYMKDMGKCAEDVLPHSVLLSEFCDKSVCCKQTQIVDFWQCHNIQEKSAL